MKNKLFKITTLSIVLFSTIILVQSCAVASLPSKPMNFTKSSENGLLVGSVTFPTNKPNFDGYFFKLQYNKSQEFEIDRNQIGQLDDGRTYLFAIKRPVGDFEISSVRLASISIFRAGNYEVKIGGFSIPYEIKKGEITYIGNIYFNDQDKRCDTVVKLNNKFKRDIDALKTIQPSINWSNVKN
ncbi:hypothetical protein [Flavobacterium sp.]|uniref:hypothetical protein n=1 Tax=Flavobacterium sp. TaxID=239 RepID=UPI003751B13C